MDQVNLDYVIMCDFQMWEMIKHITLPLIKVFI